LASLSKEASGDPALTRELAAAYEKVGDIQGQPSAGNVGNTEGAVQSYQQAISLRQSLHDAESADPAIRMAMAPDWLSWPMCRPGRLSWRCRVSNCRRAVFLAEQTLQAHSGFRPAVAVLAQATQLCRFCR
jgi:hypothetical protein